MIGKKSLAEIRAELEAALGKGPDGDSSVAQSLRRFLAGKSGKGKGSKKSKRKPG